MKKTAVEWLEEQMKTWGDKPRWMRDDIVEQAKAMEKEQIEKALLTGLVHWDVDKPIEQYYNETYKNTDYESETC